MPAWDRREPGTVPWFPPISSQGFLLYLVPDSSPDGLLVRASEARNRGETVESFLIVMGLSINQQKPWGGTPQLSNT